MPDPTAGTPRRHTFTERLLSRHDWTPIEGTRFPMGTFLGFVFALAALALRGFNRASRRNVSDYPTLSELSYGDLPSWPSVRVG